MSIMATSFSLVKSLQPCYKLFCLTYDGPKMHPYVQPELRMNPYDSPRERKNGEVSFIFQKFVFLLFILVNNLQTFALYFLANSNDRKERVHNVIDISYKCLQ